VDVGIYQVLRQILIVGVAHLRAVREAGVVHRKAGDRAVQPVPGEPLKDVG
jgi:hypothetical protein